MAEVEVRNLSLHFGKTKALEDVTLNFPNGQFFGLLGPSGSGKTTLLRAIAGFVSPHSGTILIGGEAVAQVPVEKREIGMMFQSYALFPNMSVADNIGFGLKVRKVHPVDLNRRVGEVLDLMQLLGLADRKPHQLSGGQKQRVALARAIVTRPRVLLLDEPLSALDKALRINMQVELKRIQREVGITTIFVTHDQEEALSLSDQIGILKDGKLIQSGPPHMLYHAPVDRFSANFLGEANLFEGSPESAGLRLSTGVLLPWPAGVSKKTDCLAVRPESISIASRQPGAKDDFPVIQGTLSRVMFSGPLTTCLVTVGSSTIKVLGLTAAMQSLPEGSRVWLSWPKSASLPL
jgi:putative spermidine/putrescine transport system ATP-binding protein